MGAIYYNINDFFLVPLYLIIIYIIASKIAKKNIKKYPEYKYFKRGLLFKLVGVSLFLIFYTFYYPTGDTISYYEGARSLVNLLSQDFNKGFQILFNNNLFTTLTGLLMAKQEDRHIIFLEILKLLTYLD
tara:strand:- start:299 stop:688 length:390 start_codon:yes stop_codon:yes gene_type:complete